MICLFSSRKLNIWLTSAVCICTAASLDVHNSAGGSSSHGRALACAEVTVIDSHGSGQGAGEVSEPGMKLVAELQELLPSTNFQTISVPFKAAGGALTLVGAALKLPAGYHKSVVKAKLWLGYKIQKLDKDCPETKVILTGYSQGAQVVGDVYRWEYWENVLGVVLFGDPYYSHTDSSDRFGLNVPPKKRIKTRLDGALGSRFDFDSPKVLSFCHQEDPFCQAPLSFFELIHYRSSQHNNYHKLGEPKLAAKHLFRLLTRKPS